MPYTTYDVKGEKESFEDMISNISPTDTKFTQITGEKTIKNKTHQWQTDEIEAVGANAKIEGWQASDTAKTPTTLLSNITQIFGKDGEVTDSNNAQDKYGRARELNYQKTLSVMAVKRDIEHAYVGTGQTQVAGSNAVAREMDGMQAQIAAANVTDLGAAALTEAAVQASCEQVFNSGGEINVMMAPPRLASVISGFAGKAAAVTATNYIGNESNKVNGYVDTYVSQLGQTLAIHYNRFVRSTDLMLLDTAKIKRLTFRPLRTVDVAKTGSSQRYFVEYEGSLMNTNPDAHALITNIG